MIDESRWAAWKRARRAFKLRKKMERIHKWAQVASWELHEAEDARWRTILTLLPADKRITDYDGRQFYPGDKAPYHLVVREEE